MNADTTACEENPGQCGSAAVAISANFTAPDESNDLDPPSIQPGSSKQLSADVAHNCQCPCCSNYDTAHQPTDLEQSKSVHGQRSIQFSWYTKHKWISVCTSTYKVFCQVCCSARKRGLVTSSKRYNLAFIEEGFSNWKKALEKFLEHEKSEMHKEALSKLMSIQNRVNIVSQLATQREMEMQHNRSMFLKVIETVIFLARQGLPLRGHHENSSSFEGNLLQLLLLRSSDCPTLGAWIKKRDYLSPEIINEVISICGQTVLRNLLQNIKAAEHYSLIADEATDISHKEQLCVAIRWVDANYSIHEAPLGLFELPNTMASTIFKAIKDIFTRCSLSFSKCTGQAYDGASNMSGIRNGVQALVKKEAQWCLYVHCFAHSLNLAVQEVTRKSELIRNCMDFIFNLVQLIKFSPKRQALFDSVQKNIAISNNESSMPAGLRTLCPTRWTVRHSAIDCILKNYEALMSTLEVVKCGSDDYAAKASGLLTQMESFCTLFALKLAYLIFSPAEQFSINLQARDTTAAEGLSGSHLLTSHYSSLRNEAKFDSFYESVLIMSEQLTDEPVLPRHRKIPKKFEHSQPYKFSSPKEMYRVAYFEALDTACGEIRRRFEQSDMGIVCELESLLLHASNGDNLPSDFAPSVQEMLSGKVDLDRLKVQLAMLHDAVVSSSLGIKRVTTIRIVADILNESNMVKGMLSEVDKLVKTYLSVPVTSSTAERSFSLLRRVKTFLRSSMTQERLNNLFLLFVLKEETQNLNIVSVANEFVSGSSRRLSYFGRF